MTTPRVILWDADGVLQRIPNDTWPLAVSVVTQVPDALTGADIDEERIRALVHSSGLDDRLDDVLSVWWTFDIVQSVLALVSQIKAQGIRCFLATNQDVYRAACMRIHTPYEQVFDGAYYSCDMGVAKPSMGFFERIVSDLAIPAQDVLFIDDQAANVACARNAGLNAEQWTHSDGVENLTDLLQSHGIRL